MQNSNEFHGSPLEAEHEGKTEDEKVPLADNWQSPVKNPDLEATEVINFNTTSLPNGIHDQQQRQAIGQPELIDEQILLTS
jgi:hypothetical protein